MEWNPRTDAWFAGFADGEACFVIARRTERSGGFSVRFQLTLRVDDIAVLERLNETFGGTLRVRPHPQGRPQAHWIVCAKRDLAKLVDYFEDFPLRAKKAKDCLIWCRAVRIVLSRGSGSHELGPLADALKDGRTYREGDEPDPLPLPVPESPQLRLVS